MRNALGSVMDAIMGMPIDIAVETFLAKEALATAVLAIAAAATVAG
ncbi:MAG: hypothetical protein ABIP44_05920 [Pseudoxanthomonas sp.]